MANKIPVNPELPPIDVTEMDEVKVGPAQDFRETINTNMGTLASAAQQLENQVGPWDSNPDTIKDRLFGNAKVFVGTEAEYVAAVTDETNPIKMNEGDIWIKIVED